VDGVVEEHDDAGAQRGADGTGRFKGQRRIQFLWRDKRSGSAAEQDGLQLAASCDASGEIDELAKSGAHGDLVDAGAGDVSAEAEKPRAGGVFRTEFRVGGSGIEEYAWNVDERLDVVDGGGLAKETRLRGKWRLVAWL